MNTPPLPEMLWEDAAASAELSSRFGFPDAAGAEVWVRDLLADEFDLRLRTLDRIVISFHSLMLWVRTRNDLRLIIKVCRKGAAHDGLRTRGALVRWLGERGLPVASPMLSCDGEHQLLREGHSIGVHPVLPGELLDSSDTGQVQVAGRTLAALHTEMAAWPDAELLHDALAVAQSGASFARLVDSRRVIPEDLRDRFCDQVAELPDLARQTVHADYRGANLLSARGAITGILDLEEARIDVAVGDLAHSICLLGTWFHDWRPISAAAQQAFLEAYSAERSLGADEQAWLPLLVARGMGAQGWSEEARRWLP